MTMNLQHLQRWLFAPAAKLAILGACVLLLRVSSAIAESQTSQLAASHWAFQSIKRPELPNVQDPAWVRNPIDAFILAKLEAAGVKPAPPADKQTLHRRLHFDLIGLPPAPEDTEAFLRDQTPGAIDDLINKLLRSPHYGERWGRHWLDVVRYGDSAGYELDNLYEHAWQYRDYVIQSFNDNKPFDRFIQEQLAGDQLWPDDPQAKIAAYFCTIGPYAQEGGIERKPLMEYLRLTELADTAGSALLGLTVGCARCHDHKTDPISQRDYFGLHAIFADSESVIVREQPKEKDRKAGMSLVLRGRAKPLEIRVLRRGELEKPQDIAPPAFLSALPGGGELKPDAPGLSKGRRAALAMWIIDPKNPLTARVLANRIWQWHFGVPLAPTPNDFGLSGEPPTNPALLDYLASELIVSRWDVRHLHQLILRSATYRMAGRSKLSPTSNVAYSHFPARKLEAEIVWDHLHAAAGTLNLKQFGPPVVPPIDDAAKGSLLNAKWEVTKDVTEYSRRGLYMVNRRSLPLPLFWTFNRGLPVESCALRESTIVPGQALALLNDPKVIELARAMAGRLLRETSDADGIALEKLVARAWLIAYARPITGDEKEHALGFLAQRETALADPKRTKRLTPSGLPAEMKISPAKAAAVVELCLALVNANEFWFVD